jgi:hypothetical protein
MAMDEKSFAQWSQWMANAVAQMVSQYVSQAPPKQYTVQRKGLTGEAKAEVTTLPQLMAEQNDLLRSLIVKMSETHEEMVEANEMLEAANGHLAQTIDSLHAQNKIAKRVLSAQG